jgi:hypothetical protein
MDVYHVNWVDLKDTRDGPTAYASMCALSQVVAVDVASGGVRWILGPGGDFTLWDPSGSPLSDDEFMQCQHGLEVEGDRVLVYDNGWDRGYTRVAQYTLDTEGLRATLDWSWAGEHWYETTLGDADWLPGDHFLATKAHAECFSSEPGAHSEILEVDQPSGEVVWRLRFEDINTTIYRAEKLSGCTLFRDVRYCEEAAAAFVPVRALLGM